MRLTAAPGGVANFVWTGEHFGPPSAATVVASPITAVRALSGQFSIHATDATGVHVLARDVLGVNKLFFTVDSGGKVHSSNYWIDLVNQGFPADSVWSVPAGHVLVISPDERRLTLERYGDLAFDDATPPLRRERRDLAADIRLALDETFRRLKTALAGRPLYVTLSGGLDSTTIAALARERLGTFTAVTFGVETGAAASDDFRVARQVAKELGVPFMPVLATPDELVELADPVLARGQDWRDFNVHCGVVNSAIGRAIRARHADGAVRPVVLTGDVMNELMADYTPVRYRGRDYYPLPSLPPGRLRRFLVRGLDTGDREVGIFASEGIDAVQPYAICADAYAAVPGGWLEHRDAKQRLARKVAGSLVPPYVYARRKVRAQVGSHDDDAGVLGVFVDRALDSAWLQARFAHLFRLRPEALPGMIRAGVYRFPTTYEALDTQGSADLCA